MVLFVASCASESPVEDFEVSGFITDRGTGAAISGATVSFVSDTQFSTATSTDEDGLYQMAVQTDRPFGQVTANAPGYETNDTTVFFDTRTRRVDLTLRSE
ncbi:MAG: hypothetical protein ACI9KE_001780 [Polyangiales bacterium]|jgi:hypothetical protein